MPNLSLHVKKYKENKAMYFEKPDDSLKNLTIRHFHEYADLINDIDSLYLIENRMSDVQTFHAKPYDVVQITHSFVLANKDNAYKCRHL